MTRHHSNETESREASLERVEEIIGHRFHDRSLLRKAITHPSAVEGHALEDSYERLEFLGDSILGAIVCTRLYNQYPEMNEGTLSRMKTALVSGASLSPLAASLGLTDFIAFGESELSDEGRRGLHSALENVYEAVVGALYLDGGHDAAAAFIDRTLGPAIDSGQVATVTNPKNELQEVVQRKVKQSPVYVIISEEGPAHRPTFSAAVMVGERELGRGMGRSKKSAESAAARDALEHLPPPFERTPRKRKKR